MKKKSLILFLLLFLVKLGWTQNTNLDYKCGVKFYNLTTFEERTKSRNLNDTSSYHYKNTTLQILHPTIAFQWKSKKNNFHEIELTSFKLGKNGTKTDIINDTTNSEQTISGSDITTTAISVRYEYILNFNKSKDSKFVPSIGFGVNPYYRQTDYSPKIANLYPTTNVSMGVRAFVTPRITYFLNSKLFIDLNIPICAFDTFYLADIENNPTIPVDDRTITTVNFHQFPKVFSVRLGIGLKL